MRLEETDIFSTFDVGKKVSSFWGLIARLADQLSGGKHEQNIYMSVFSCTYIRIKNLMCIVLCSDKFVLKFITH